MSVLHPAQLLAHHGLEALEVINVVAGYLVLGVEPIHLVIPNAGANAGQVLGQIPAQVVVTDGAALVYVPKVEADGRCGAYRPQVRCVPLTIPS